MSGRMNKVMYDILKTDETTTELDEKRMHRGNMELLNGFRWDKERSLSLTLNAKHSVEVDKDSGRMVVQVAAFVPRRTLKAPAGGSHFELFANGAALDFEQMKCLSGYAGSGVRPINGVSTGEFNLDCSVENGAGKQLVVGLGIVFYQAVADRAELLADGGCFEIVGVG
jgi:hypothetical protein